jgi:hypothetical protein
MKLERRELRSAGGIVLLGLALAAIAFVSSPLEERSGCACSETGEALSLCVCVIAGAACSQSTFCGAGVSLAAAPRSSRLRLSTWFTSARGFTFASGLRGALETLASVSFGTSSSVEPVLAAGTHG